MVLTYQSVGEMPNSGYSNEGYRPVLSCGVVYCASQGSSQFRISRRNSERVTVQMKVPGQLPIVQQHNLNSINVCFSLILTWFLTVRQILSYLNNVLQYFLFYDRRG